jgi:CheY-like chemotaxis protein
MPGLDGYELCRRIRREPWGGGVAIVAITGWGQQEDRRRSAEAGFDLHLVKPVDADVLVQALREVRADTPGSGPR